MKRICKKCEIEKELSDYYLKKNGSVRSSYCKNCYNIVYKTKYSKEYYEDNKELFKESYKNWSENNDRKEYMLNYRKENADKLRQNSKEFRENNKELVAQRKNDYYNSLTPEQKDQLREKKKANYYNNHKQYRDSKNKYFNNRIKNDSIFKLVTNIRSLISNSFKRCDTIKSTKTIEILGCSFEEFKIHLENKFDDKMNWDNQGSYWHMDHVIPISSAQTEEEVYRLNHYTNFQPLYWKDNLIKSNKFK